MVVSREQLTTQFFDEILNVARRYGGDLLVERFYKIKEQRERYLREQWADYIDDIGPVVIRDIDYDHLITLLSDSLNDDFDVHFRLKLRVAKICLQYGQFEKARILLVNLEVPDNQEDKQAELKMLLGKLSILTNDHDTGTRYYKEASVIYKKIDDTRGLASAYNNLGIISYEQWQTEAGKEYFQNAQVLFSEFEDSALKMAIRGNLAIVEMMRGEETKAAEIYKSLLKQVEEENLAHRAYLSINYGIATGDSGDIEKASEILNQAHDIALEVKDQRLIAVSKLARAEIYVNQKNYDQALEELHQAFKIFSALHYSKGIADIYRVFGILHTKQDYFELADKEFQISLRINREQGSILNLAEVYYSYSKLAGKENKKEKQKEYLENALLLYKSMQAIKRIERVEQELQQF